MRFSCVGAVQEGYTCYEALLQAGYRPDGLVTLTDERGQRLSGWVPWDGLAARYHVPLVKVPTINGPEADAALRALAPDILFVIGWTELLRPPLLAIPTRGCIGMHASLLPYYRGSAPVNWCLIHGETETGNTMFWLTPDVDTGDIIAQRRIPILFRDTCATLYDKVARAGIAMLVETLPALLADAAPRQFQKLILPEMPRRRPHDGLIDWAKSPVEQYNWVRALTHPYPGAFTHWHGRRVQVWRARPLHGASPVGSQPGQVLGRRGEALVVHTGDGLIGLSRLQPDGSDEMTGAAFFAEVLQGQVGDRFITQEEVVHASAGRERASG